MRFMNELDIEDAVRRWWDHPILGPAVRTLDNLQSAANKMSDGWAYWPKSARAAAKLMELIERDGTSQYRHGDRPDVTMEEYRKALRPIKAFRSRYGLSFLIDEG